MKKIYETPEVKVQVINSTDVITLSSVGSVNANALKKISATSIEF